jgi:hypothetical protein
MNSKLTKRFGSKPIVWVPMWGLSKLRKRGGRFDGEIAGEALWYDQWYDRVMSRENMETLAELGVNLIVLPFSLGASSSAERKERDVFEKMTQHLHDLGMYGLPYLQYQNVLQEEHVPQGSIWATRLDGGAQQYSYWRRTVCQSSSGFIDYFKQTIGDAMRRGADGIWIDNNYLHPCRCASCARTFVEYLEKNRGDLLDLLYLKDFSHVEIPPVLDRVDDPIVQAFVDFNCARNTKIHRELKAHLESIDADALFASNPALFRGNSYAERGIDLYEMFHVNDMIYLENAFFPEAKDGQTSGNYHGFIVGDALGAPGIPGGWKTSAVDATPDRVTLGLPASVADIERALLEPAVFGGVVGAFWAIRTVPRAQCATARDQLQMYYETPAIHEAMRETLTYIRSLPVFGERRNLADIAVFYHADSMTLDFDRHHAALHGMEELLMTSSIPHNALHSHDLESRIDDYRLVILPETRLVRDREAAILEKYVRKGGRLLLLGRDCGFYDESRRPRLDSILREVSGASCFGELQSPCYNKYGQGMCALISGKGACDKTYINLSCATVGSASAPNWLNNPAEILEVIDKLLNGKRQVVVDSESSLAVTVAEIDRAHIAVQLFSYAEETAPRQVRVEVDVPLMQDRVCTLYGLGNAAREIASEGGNRFTIHDFQRHAALILTRRVAGA